MNAAKFAPEAGEVAVYAELEPSGRRSSSATAARLRRRRGPGRPPRACASRSSAGWNGPAAPRRSTRRPGAGTEVELTIEGGAMSALPTVVIVDDHEIFRAGVRAELEGLVDVLGDVGSVEEAVRLILDRASGCRSPRRPHARRRWCRGDPADRRE